MLGGGGKGVPSVRSSRDRHKLLTARLYLASGYMCHITLLTLVGFLPSTLLAAGFDNISVGSYTIATYTSAAAGVY